MSIEQLEQRMSNLELAVNRIADQLDLLVPGEKKRQWWEEAAGAFANDPIYAEIVTRGAEYRESLRPKDEGGEVTNGDS